MRLPRDWLGPREELVPIGAAARARAAQRAAEPGLDDAPPPAAEAFWSEDSAALHDAVQGPAAAPAERPGTPASGVGVRSPDRPGQWVTRPRAAALAIGVASLIVLAVIGSSEQPRSRVPGRPAPAGRQLAAVTAGQPTDQQLTAAATERATVRGTTATRHRGAARAHIGSGSHDTRGRAGRHHVSHSRGTAHRQPATAPTPRSPAPTYAVVQPTQSSTGSGALSTGSTESSPAASSSSVAHTPTSTPPPPFGQSGTLAPGSSPDS